MNYNLQLVNLYKEKYPDLAFQINNYNKNIIINGGKPEDRATNPLLIKVNDDWALAENKIMILGKETNYWAGECGNNAVFCDKIEEILNVYEGWYLKDTMYNSPFWNEFRRIRRGLENNDQKLSVIWNNVIKIGRLGKGNVPEINKIIKNTFDILSEEIKILRPNILVLLTGPDYDNYIKEFIGEFEYESIEGYNYKELSFMKFHELPFIRKAIRTYHPQFLYYNSLNRVYIQKVISELK